MIVGLLNVQALAKLRPYLYHLTAAENIPLIRQQRWLCSAAHLFNQAGRPDLIRVRRRAHETITVDGVPVTIRDQAPLHSGNVALGAGWSFEDVITELNNLIFFWPGDEDGPIPHGRRHFARYSKENVRIIRVPLLDLVSVNPNQELLVCKYNSGSPRWNNGRPSPRSVETFAPIDRAALRASQVIEVVFRDEIELPPSTVIANAALQKWITLWRLV